MENIPGRHVSVFGRKCLFGRQGSLPPLLLGELALRQWWWAFGWYGCSIGWWEPPGGSSDVHAARWPPWGESVSAGIRPDKASCPWRLLEAPSSSLGAALQEDAPCSATGGEKRDGGWWGRMQGGRRSQKACVPYWEQNTTSGTLLLWIQSDRRGSHTLWL